VSRRGGVRPWRGGLRRAVLPLLAACTNQATATTGQTPPVEECSFTNPLASGADPWVVRQAGSYYFVQSRDRAIWVYKSDKLTEPTKNGVQVWRVPDAGWNRTNVWAPELHHLDGRWYIYYAAGEAGPPFIYQRSGVLQSAGEDPQGGYVDKGMLYTGNDVQTSMENVWAIDLTVTRLGGQLYAVWSGWEGNRSTDRTPQHLYIARMSDPWTISSDRVRISSPVESWERGTELDLNEGPEFLRRGDEVFVIYSARESWLKDYRLGQLRLKAHDADPMDPNSWIKRGPVFMGTETVYGVGHASFTTSPDGNEDWIVYHSKADPTPSWDRVIRMQKFGWRPDGSPDFGTPVASGQPVPVPSGQCR
jgi:GH43 family beta-xylosidase